MDSPIDVEKAIDFYKRTKASQKKAMTKYRKSHPEVIKAINKRYCEKKRKEKEIQESLQQAK